MFKQQMKYIFSFMLGVGICWVFMDKYNGELLEFWQVAYTIGKDDGYELGRSDVSIYEDFSFQQKEALCMFLYAERKKN